MKVIAVANQKGGVGKTTSSVTLAGCLAERQLRTLFLDLDPQANGSSALGFDRANYVSGSYELLLGDELDAAIHSTAFPMLDMVAGHPNLAAAELELVSVLGRESRLKDILVQCKERYDMIVIDTPPTLGLLTVNALTAAQHLLIPMQCEYFAMEGLSQLLKTVELIKLRLNPSLSILGILITMFDKRTRLTLQIAEQIERHFENLLFNTRIPRNVKLSEASSFGKLIQAYEPNSIGAKAYGEFADEVIGRLQGEQRFNSLRLHPDLRSSSTSQGQWN